jgi:hypothetical protein
MALNNIIQNLTSFIQTKLSIPLTPIPAIMLICSTIKRPGLSTMLITSRAINKMGEKGVPIGVNIDGSPNMMNQLIYVIVDEIVNALKMEGKVEVSIPPGGITSLGFGANAGGMVSVTSTNVGAVSGSGIMR